MSNPVAGATEHYKEKNNGDVCRKQNQTHKQTKMPTNVTVFYFEKAQVTGLAEKSLSFLT